jgi:tRNA (guanine37-N1)-methyltransferase
MRFDLITIFPEFFAGPLDYGILRKAREANLVSVNVQNLREFTHDRHRTVDDRPFGGGEGMVLKPEPLFEAVESLLGHPDSAAGPNTAVVLLSAAGRLFRQETVARLSKLQRIVLICGRYEGVDERVAAHLATEEISIGDFVLSGGELPAAMIMDAVSRLIPGALGNEDSALNESFTVPEEDDGGVGPDWRSAPALAPHHSRHHSAALRLDYPHYTRPQVFRGWGVPEVLLSGNHADIRRWRRGAALERTLRNRPELLSGTLMSPEDRRILKDILAHAPTEPDLS